MLHSSFPPKSQPRFSQRRAGLYVVKATAAFGLVFSFAAMPPAHAQGLPPGWSASPCDAQGNPLTSPQQRNGFYEMDGTKSGTASNTYPPDWVASLGSNPTGGASPLTVTTIPTMPTYNGVGIAGYPTYGSFASNELDGGIYTYYTSTSSGLINGSVTTHIDGQLVYYFLVQWSGGGTPTVQMPKSISLLLNTNLFASVLLSYGSSKQTSGLSASSSAADSTFQEMASSPGPTSVVGYHLVQASVSPLTATTGIAETYLNGTVDQTASDPIPAGAYVAGHGYQPPNGSSPAVANGTTASANSEVSAGVRQDNRSVAISANVDITNMKSPALNPDGSVEFDAYNNIVFVAVPHTPDVDGTMYGDYGIGYGSDYIPGDPDPDDLYPVKYTTHLAGTWGASTTYNWYSSLKSSGGGGPTFTNVYIGAAALPQDSGPPLINPGETGTVDHIHLTVTDSNDGATGTANYYMALHQPDNFLPSNQAGEYVPKEMELRAYQRQAMLLLA